MLSRRSMRCACWSISAFPPASACSRKCYGRVVGRIIIMRGRERAEVAKRHRVVRLSDHLGRAARAELIEFIGNPVAGEKRWMVNDMHVQMRFGRAAGIADVAEDLPRGYMVANFNRHRSRAHMSVENVMMLSDIDDNVVTARVDEVDIDGILAGMRNILWQAVHRRYHRALGDAVDRRVV